VAAATQEVVRKQTELAQLEADRKQKELIASTIRPAEADADAQVKRAEGEKLSRIAAAQADAERVRLAGQAEAAINVMKGEAQARVTLVNAESIAKQTTLEGNAEAGVVLSKGEAEAKALALRAEAYRQFNEAAVIQTVLSMLPEIVRAAAEPMGQIDNLTVMSADGASELVKNTTRTVAEASTAVKGLTGIDIPGLIGSSMGARFGGSGGSGGGGGSSTKPTPTRPTKPGSGSSGTGGTSGGGESPTAARRRVAAPPASASTASATHAIASPPAPPVATPTPDPRATLDAAVSTAQQTADRARAAIERATAPAAGRSAGSVAGAAGLDAISRDTTVDEAASALADELMRIPGIQRFGDMRLRDLDATGPRPLRTMWRIARDQLDQRYGDLTIGQVIDQYRDQGGMSAGA
jgi:hypothetical protein